MKLSSPSPLANFYSSYLMVQSKNTLLVTFLFEGFEGGDQVIGEMESEILTAYLGGDSFRVLRTI